MPRIIPVSGFYVYVLARPNMRVFYVGKGRNDRILDHEDEARRGCSCHKCRVIRKIWRSGGEVQRSIVFVTDSEREALDYEIELIAQYGRENLTNKTNGGDGISGFRQPEESIRKRVAKNTGKKRTPEQRMRISLGAKGRPGKPHTPETIEKIKATQRGVPKPKHTPEMNQLKSERQKGRPRPPITEETRQKLRDSHKGKKLGPFSPERVQKMLAGRSGIRRPDSEETRRKKSEALKGRKVSKETRQKIRESLIRRKQQITKED